MRNFVSDCVEGPLDVNVTIFMFVPTLAVRENIVLFDVCFRFGECGVHTRKLVKHIMMQILTSVAW